MTLKEAREKGKLAEFISEKEKEQKPANAARFKKVLQSMASGPAPAGSRSLARQKKKPTQGTSPKDSSAS